ncbi:hypothetical protein AB0O95_09805 [Rhodoglobus sp. NPDC076762]
MSDGKDEPRKVRFYSAHDLAAGLHAPRALELVLAFDPAAQPRNVEDALELHNAREYVEHGVFPPTLTAEQRDRLGAITSNIRSAIARFFSDVDNSNFVVRVADVSPEYRTDLLSLLGQYKVIERCDSDIVLPALKSAGIHLGEMLASKPLVAAYDGELRDELIASPRAAEYLVRKYLEKDPRRAIHLPPSFTRTDSHDLLVRYIDHDDANLNYVRLIANSNDHAVAGIDAKLRLRAKRRSDELNAELFAHGQTFKTGVELSVSDNQNEPVLVETDTSDGQVQKYTYSKRWLDGTLDFASVLNNFQHLFEFVDENALLSFPAYPAALDVMERVMGLTGVAEYKIGSAFRATDSKSLLQTLMYRQFLDSHELDLEEIIGWFCGTYLADEFGAHSFSFHPSVGDAAYLQKVRHLFAEMESLANQFALFVENGEVDRELLTVGSEQVRYKALPSLLEGKYVYPAGGQEFGSILNLLFSDQSSLQYISETLRAHNAASLLMNNKIAYESFHQYQKPDVDLLIQHGILENTGRHVGVTSQEQLLVLATLFNTQAANYYHLSHAGRAQVDAMEDKGWVVRRSSLLTDAEGDYFNYYLNRVGFSNGPNLRNRYQHGAQAGDADSEHFNVYFVALRLLIALVIKMNDDFCLSAAENAAA